MDETRKKSCLDYAREKMKEILAAHDPTPLPKDQNEEILKEARRYYKEKKQKLAGVLSSSEPSS